MIILPQELAMFCMVDIVAFADPTSATGEVLFCEREDGNPIDPYAVAIKSEGSEASPNCGIMLGYTGWAILCSIFTDVALACSLLYFLRLWNLLSKAAGIHSLSKTPFFVASCNVVFTSFRLSALPF